MTDRYDVCIVGGGSGGIGAAISAARAGLKTIIIERSPEPGGTANRCGVNMWESGVGGTGIPFEIYLRLKKIPYATSIYGYERHFLWQGRKSFPGGELVVCPDKQYINTLVRHGMRNLKEDENFARNNLFGVIFEPKEYAKVIMDMLEETATCRILLNTQFVEVHHNNERITHITLSNGETIYADFWIDGTGDGCFCFAAGCRRVKGQESKKTYGEPSAPEKPNDRMNGVSLIFRIKPRKGQYIDTLSKDIPDRCWWQKQYPFASIVSYPNDDRNVNILPIMLGEEFLNTPYDISYKECHKRCLSWWHYVQKEYPEFRGYEIHSFFPEIGVRETYRVIGEYILTEGDVKITPDKNYFNDTITIADHSLDRHGAKAGGNLKRPYPIPYRCLIPKGYTNLLIACRAASFSSIAASSCRLSRTIMQLGQAAGTACAIAKKTGCELPAVPSEVLHSELVRQNIQLTWPLERVIRNYLIKKEMN
ncbi:MAG: FAD-dependent oxidoreductase [Spirochaetales bacterium]|nr:FAD-dependent oxidoreductase [Spirochaetales bacterium]